MRVPSVRAAEELVGSGADGSPATGRIAAVVADRTRSARRSRRRRSSAPYCDEVARLDRVAVALDDDGALGAGDLERRRELERWPRLPASPVTVTASETAPEGAAEAHRSAAADSVADGVGSALGAADEHPASSSADRAAADRAAIGRMRTVNLEMKGKGEPPSSPMFPLSPLRTGMPIPEWNREYPRRVTSDPARRAGARARARGRRRGERGRDRRPRRMGATYYLGRFIITPLARARLPPAHRGPRPRFPRAARSSSRATTCRSSTRSRSRSRLRGPSTSSRSRATSRAPACRAGCRASSSPRSARSRCSAAPVRRPSTPSTSSGCCSSRAAPSRSTPRARARSTAASTRAAPAWPSSRCRPARPSCPVGLVGTDKVMPVGAKLPSLRHRVTVRFGEPLDLSHHGPATPARPGASRPTTSWPPSTRLSGQELANAYNEVPAHTPIERIKQVLPHERR